MKAYTFKCGRTEYRCAIGYDRATQVYVLTILYRERLIYSSAEENRALTLDEIRLKVREHAANTEMPVEILWLLIRDKWGDSGRPLPEDTAEKT